MDKTSKSYWESCYRNDEIGWDIGYVSNPLKSYFEQVDNKDLRILIPGAGNGYEAVFLFNSGFKNITVLDIAKQPLENIKKRVPDFPEERLVQADFFTCRGTYDLIVEQTFYCAIHPSQRGDYVKKTHELLSPGGKLVGLLFDFPLTAQGPPYGGSKEEYTSAFSKFYKIRTLETSINSIKPRQGRELFIIFEKKITGNKMSKSIILNKEEIAYKIRRIAYQIYEANINEKEIIIAGISDNGFIFAKELVKVLNDISDVRISLCEVKMNKKKPLDGVTTSMEPRDYANKPLILVDDVLNSGSTLMYAVRHFLDVPLKLFLTAVLVNRNHKKYPVKADFKGISLSTSLHDTVTVDFDKNGAKAYLD